MRNFKISCQRTGRPFQDRLLGHPSQVATSSTVGGTAPIWAVVSSEEPIPSGVGLGGEEDLDSASHFISCERLVSDPGTDGFFLTR